MYHSSVDRHFGCFHVLAIVSDAAMNIGVHVSFQINVVLLFFLMSIFGFFRSISNGRIAVSYGRSIFTFFEEHPYYFPQWLHEFTFLPVVYEGRFLFLHISIIKFCYHF